MASDATWIWAQSTILINKPTTIKSESIYSQNEWWVVQCIKSVFEIDMLYKIICCKFSITHSVFYTLVSVTDFFVVHTFFACSSLRLQVMSFDVNNCQSMRREKTKENAMQTISVTLEKCKQRAKAGCDNSSECIIVQSNLCVPNRQKMWFIFRISYWFARNGACKTSKDDKWSIHIFSTVHIFNSLDTPFWEMACNVSETTQMSTRHTYFFFVVWLSKKNTRCKIYIMRDKTIKWKNKLHHKWISRERATKSRPAFAHHTYCHTYPHCLRIWAYFNEKQRTKKYWIKVENFIRLKNIIELLLFSINRHSERYKIARNHNEMKAARFAITTDWMMKKK